MVAEVQSLRSQVMEAAQSDESLSAGARAWIAASLATDEVWTEACDGGPVPLVPGDEDVERQDSTTYVGGHLYIDAIEVEGFRGIGPTSLLDLPARPGLVVISGRNGSGKSSFAEALEIAITGRSARLDSHTGVWLSQWQNLTHQPTRVSTQLLSIADGSTQSATPSIQIDVEWQPNDKVDAGTTTVYQDGVPVPDGRKALGWELALQHFRPILTYEELGRLLDSQPSKMHDELNELLGLELLQIAAKRLKDLETQCNEAVKHAKEAKKEAERRASDLSESDSRAQEAKQLLAKHSPDRDALTALARGSLLPQNDMVARLNLVATWCKEVANGLQSLEAQGVAADLRAWREQTELHTTQLVERQELRDQLLKVALQWHREGEEVLCPVCEQGNLSGTWRQHAEEVIERGRVERQQLSVAQDKLATAKRTANRFLKEPSPPSAALDALVEEGFQWAQVIRDGYQAWSIGADLQDVGALAGHFDQQRPAIVQIMQDGGLEADQESAARNDAWQPVVEAINDWAAKSRLVDEGKDQRDAVSGAHAWLKAQTGALRNERIAPISQEASRIWQELRQQSSVSLEQVTLVGTNTSRRLQISARIDDEDDQPDALAVMSQGELHALALSLFLPRATRPESPFRFIMLDDPIQAMDPAKVEGFVKVVESFAQKYQVIVFSHDDRLAATIRRAECTAEIFEVSRSAGSRVFIRQMLSPAHRYIEDARAVAADRSLPEATLRRILPVLLRSALEAAARDSFFDRELKSGRSLEYCERLWLQKTSTSDRLKLGLGMEGEEFESWLKQGSRSRVLGMTTSAVHDELRGDVRASIDAVSDVIKELSAQTSTSARQSS